MLLALDTSTGNLGAAVLAGGRVLAEVTHPDSRRHGELLAPAMEQALAEAGATIVDLEAVVVGVGPGPFTGLRVGVVTGLVLGEARGIPVHGICSLDALAAQAIAEQVVNGPFLVATDARRKEVYWARYTEVDGLPCRAGEPQVGRAGDLPEDVRALPTVGRGPLLYDALTRAADTAPTDVHPGWVGAVAHRALTAGDGQEAPATHGLLRPPEPLYLRRPDATEPGPPKVAS